MQLTSTVGGRCLHRGLLLSTFLLAAGCGSKGSVSGKVTFKDKPLPGGQVVFLAENGRSYGGPINDDGTYNIVKVPAGLVKISIMPKEPPKLVGGPGGPGQGRIPKDVKFGPPKDSAIPEDVKKGFESAMKPGQQGIKGFPDKYKDPKTSELSYTVTGGEQTYDIPLK